MEGRVTKPFVEWLSDSTLSYVKGEVVDVKQEELVTTP